MRHAPLTAAAVLVLFGASPATAAGSVCTTHFEQVPAAPARADWYVEVEVCERGPEASSAAPTYRAPASAPSKVSAKPLKAKLGKSISTTGGTRVPGTVKRPFKSGTSSTVRKTGVRVVPHTQISGKAASATASAVGAAPSLEAKSPKFGGWASSTVPPLAPVRGEDRSANDRVVAPAKKEVPAKAKLADTGASWTAAGTAATLVLAGVGAAWVGRRRQGR